MPLVFVVDDDPVTCEGISAVLAKEGHEIRTFTRPREALKSVLLPMGRITPPRRPASCLGPSARQWLISKAVGSTR